MRFMSHRGTGSFLKLRDPVLLSGSWIGQSRGGGMRWLYTTLESSVRLSLNFLLNRVAEASAASAGTEQGLLGGKWANR